jgi:hypothetical protein
MRHNYNEFIRPAYEIRRGADALLSPANVRLEQTPHMGRLPMLLHYVCLDSQVHGFGRAKQWAELTCWNASKVVFWTEAELRRIMSVEERDIYDHYALPAQKLYFASYLVLCAFGGIFLHPHYVPHTLLWPKVKAVWEAHSQECGALLAARGGGGPRPYWNGLLVSTPAPAQYLKQLAVPRYLTPVSTPDDVEFTTGGYLLAQLERHTLTTGGVGHIAHESVTDMVHFAPFHSASKAEPLGDGM